MQGAQCRPSLLPPMPQGEKGVWEFGAPRERAHWGVAIWSYFYDFAFLGLFVLLVGGTIVCLLVFPWGDLIQGFVHTRQALSL